MTFANGCAGSLPAAHLLPRALPVLGGELQVDVSHLPSDALIMVVGWQRTAPQSLAAYGRPACFWHVSIDASVLVLGSAGRALFRLGMPAAPAYLGLQFHNQAFVLDPNHLGGLRAVVSDAAVAVVGAR